jgi:mycothiol maleylpyruvate isomerase-like protein
MNVDRSFVAKNESERARLKAFVARASDAELGRSLPAGWTVAAVLAHVAFWDQRALVLLERWRQTGTLPTPANDADVDWINDASKPMFLALPPRRAAEVAVAIAETIDRQIEALPDELVARNAAAGSPLNLLRAEHRHEHLNEIEAALR